MSSVGKTFLEVTSPYDQVIMIRRSGAACQAGTSKVLAVCCGLTCPMRHERDDVMLGVGCHNVRLKAYSFVHTSAYSYLPNLLSRWSSFGRLDFS